jgi:hypothetical protein
MELLTSHADYGDIVDKKGDINSCLQSVTFKAAYLEMRTHDLENPVLETGTTAALHPSIRFQSLPASSLLISGSALSSLESFGNSLSAILESSASRSSASASIF